MAAQSLCSCLKVEGRQHGEADRPDIRNEEKKQQGSSVLTHGREGGGTNNKAKFRQITKQENERR